MAEYQNRLEVNRGYADAPCAVKKDTASQATKRRFETVVGRLATLADRTENALYAITRPATPKGEAICEAPRPMPPLFDELNGAASQIESLLYRIEDVLDRLEL